MTESYTTCWETAGAPFVSGLIAPFFHETSFQMKRRYCEAIGTFSDTVSVDLRNAQALRTVACTGTLLAGSLLYHHRLFPNISHYFSDTPTLRTEFFVGVGILAATHAASFLHEAIKKRMSLEDRLH